MPFPVKPQDVQAIIPSASASWCAKLLQFPLRLGYLFLNAITYMVKPDGGITDDFKAWIGVTVDGTTPGQVPVSVSATDGTFTDKVQVTWSFPGSAPQFKVYRSPDQSTANAILVATVVAPTYDDVPPGPAGTVYTYFVKATVNGVDTDYSAGNTGYVSTGTTPPSGTTVLIGHTQGNYPVTPGKEGLYVVEVWGGGGGGGASWWWSAFGTGTGNVDPCIGSSGGGGGYAVLQIAAEVGDIFYATAGQGGAGGPGSNDNSSGLTGQDTVIVLTRPILTPTNRELVRGKGGGGGQVSSGAGGSGGAPGDGSYLANDPDVTVSGGNAIPGQIGNPRITTLPKPVPPNQPDVEGGLAGDTPPQPTDGKGGNGGKQLQPQSSPVPGSPGYAGLYRVRKL